MPSVNLIWNKYYSHSNTHTPHAHSENGSFWWKDIFRLIPILRAITMISIGKGDTALFRKDNWTGKILQEELNSLFCFAKSEDISFKGFRELNILDQTLHLPLSVQALQQWQLPANLIQEMVISQDLDQWTYQWNSQQYQSKKVYNLFFSHIQPAGPITSIWKSKCTLKLKVFIWLLLMDRLNTKELLQRKHFNTQGGIMCVTCNSMLTEDSLHLFFTCPFA